MLKVCLSSMVLMASCLVADAGVTRSRTVTRQTNDAPAVSSPTPIEANNEAELGAVSSRTTQVIVRPRVFGRVAVQVSSPSQVVSSTRTKTKSVRCSCGCNKKNCNCGQ